MPTYDYVCRACGAELELFQSITARPRRKCAKCGKNTLERRIGTGAGILFRGSGFYQTDYRSASYSEGQKAENSSDAKPAAESSSDASKPKSESKPESKPASEGSKKKKPDSGTSRG
jgi:putative FmdB family regulatory protein